MSTERNVRFMLVALLISIAAVVTLEGCGVRRTADLNAIKSDVERLPANTSQAESVSAGNRCKMYEGDGTSVDQEGYAKLDMGGCLLEIFRDTDLHVEGIPSESAPVCIVEFEHGTIYNRVQKKTIINTEWAVITAIGTEFLVHLDPNRQIIWIIVVHGVVQVEAAGQRVEVRDGQQTWVWRGQPPEPPHPATRAAVGDLFPRVETLTNSILSDPVVLAESTAQPCAPGVLYCENFNNGQAEGWDLGPGWKVGREGANYALDGSEHYWATLPGQAWDDYRFRFRLKLVSGTIHLNYRLADGPVRYFIGFHQGGLYLSKQIRDSFTDLAAVEASHPLNRWYQVEIVGWGGHLQVYVDGKLELDYTDRAPLPRGTIAFETLEGSQALVDDIEVLPPGPEPVRPAPTPTRTPMPAPPDLLVTTWRNTGPVTRGYASTVTARLPGDFEVPFQVVVKNQGGLPAGIFKVSVSYTGPEGTFVAPFTVPGQKDNQYPYTSAPLATGASVTFEGTVTLPARLQGQTVSLRALADSCAGEERMPGYCRVEESNEGNNESAPVAVSLPAPGLTAPTQLSPANGSVFENYPRTTRLQWSPVPGAATYTVEIDAYDPGSGRWFSDIGGKPWDLVPNIKETSYTFDFVGAQPGRWRVWAVDANGQEGPQSAWWEFRYTR